MKIINLLAQHRELVRKWETPPTRETFEAEYIRPNERELLPLLKDFQRFREYTLHDFILTIDWNAYRKHVLENVDAAKMEKEVRGRIETIESLLGVKLAGEAILFHAFTLMDGYARYHMGAHQLYLGLDEPFENEFCRNVLISHELSHVAREPIDHVWRSHGLESVFDHDLMSERLPSIEHLFSEGFACLISEVMNPDHPAAHYTYQTTASFDETMKNADAVDDHVHRVLKEGNYFSFYDVEEYAKPVPHYAHYIWAWRWVKAIYEKEGPESLQRMNRMSSRELFDDATRFKLSHYR